MSRTRPSQAADSRIEAAIGRLDSQARLQSIVDYKSRMDDILQIVRAHHCVGGREQGGRRGVDALNRSALGMLTGHFQGFVMDLFAEGWGRRRTGAPPAWLMKRIRFFNPWPADIDGLFAILGIPAITVSGEIRPAASAAGPSTNAARPTFCREQTKHQARQVVAEMVAVRNRVVHGGLGVPLTLRDVTVYLTDTVYVGVGMARQL